MVLTWYWVFPSLAVCELSITERDLREVMGRPVLVDNGGNVRQQVFARREHIVLRDWII